MITEMKLLTNAVRISQKTPVQLCRVNGQDRSSAFRFSFTEKILKQAAVN